MYELLDKHYYLLARCAYCLAFFTLTTFLRFAGELAIWLESLLSASIDLNFRPKESLNEQYTVGIKVPTVT